MKAAQDEFAAGAPKTSHSPQLEAGVTGRLRLRRQELELPFKVKATEVLGDVHEGYGEVYFHKWSR